MSNNETSVKLLGGATVATAHGDLKVRKDYGCPRLETFCLSADPSDPNLLRKCPLLELHEKQGEGVQAHCPVARESFAAYPVIAKIGPKALDAADVSITQAELDSVAEFLAKDAQDRAIDQARPIQCVVFSRVG